MRRKLTKTIILIVFVVFLGIKNVNAITCTYSRNVNGEEQTYIIDLEKKTVTYQTFRIPMAQPTSETLTGVPITFTECPASIKVTTTSTPALPGFETPRPGFESGTMTATVIEDAGNDGDYKLELDREYGENVSPLKPGSEDKISCGKITNIPANIPKTTRILYLLLQVLVPVVLIILGMLDLAKAVMAQKEDEIKKGQQTFIKRLITAAIVFFVFAVVKMLASFLQDSATVTDCLNCFISGECVDSEALESAPEEVGEEG